MFKLLVILPFVASLAGTAVAAPIGTDFSLVARKASKLAAATGPTPCTDTDQSAAAFGGGEDPDENLPQCSDVTNPFSCTNIQAVATAFNLPLCSEAGTAAGNAAVAAASASAASKASAAAAAAATAPPTPCTDTDQSAAAFGGDGEDPDVNLPQCGDVANPFSCTNIQAVATDFNLPLCSEAGTAAGTAAVAAASASAASKASAAAAAAATAAPTPCTDTDQSAAAFGGDGEDPDVNLPQCSDVANPFSCTNIQAVATDFKLPLCSEAGAA
ncbi:hypothetical protein B0H12DRAFT_1073426 [Mycena haematopus]|nr:hypothetical protein B0H12DRAFT_1073426 [Mycena haematopus]